MYNLEVSERDPFQEYVDLQFGVRRSIRYHKRRQQWFEFWATFTSGMSALFGSAAIFSLFTTAGNLGRILAAVFAAIVTSFQFSIL